MDENTPVNNDQPKPSDNKPRTTMRHPHTEHEVEATQEELIPLMYRGYQQVRK